VSFLHESRNEWCAQLLNILTPLIMNGFKLIFNDGVQLCRARNEPDKYLKTFQNLLANIPKWNETVLTKEKDNIITQSGCTYLEELIACVHIIQLKLLTAIRVGSKQKKVDIHIPKLDSFIHKIYITAARKIYKNVYLFEMNISPLESQKYSRGLELIVQECIMSTIRSSIPIENILRAYMDETHEEDVIEEVKEEVVHSDPEATSQSEVVSETATTPEVSGMGGGMSDMSDMSDMSGVDGAPSVTADAPDVVGVVEPTPPVLSVPPSAPALSFNDMDSVRESNNVDNVVSAPKTIERLEEISSIRNTQRKMEDEENDGSDSLVIGGDMPDVDINLNIQPLSLDLGDVNISNKLEDIEIVN